MIRRLMLWYISLGRSVLAGSVLAYMAGIFFLSSMKFTIREVTLWDDMLFNLAHVPLYFGLMVLLSLLFRDLFTVRPGSSLEMKWIFAAMGVLFLFAASDEYHQSFTGRCMSAWDLLSDMIGGMIGMLVVGHLLDRRPGAPGLCLSGGGLIGLAVFFVYLAV
jgi:hypothetical protein